MPSTLYPSAGLLSRFTRLVLVALALCACSTRPEVTSLVGETAITAEDIAYRQAVMAVRSGQEFPPHLALLQIIQESLMAEIGQAYDIVVSKDMLAAEAARVQADSRDPKTLARIQAIFGDDEAAYHRLVLQPILINQLLHARFSLGHDIQAKPLARAQALLTAARAAPASLPALAKEFGGEYRQLEIVEGRIRHGDDPGEAIAPELAQPDVEWPDYDREFIEQIVAKGQIGELHPKVVEDRYSFMLVRLLSREGDHALLESVVIAKLDFVSWFQAQSQRVPLTINDRALREAILAEVDLPYITDRLSTGE